jgi:hypothetical protein
MANNRLYLYCKKCGKATTIAKSMGDGWYSTDNALDEFFERHNPHNKEDGYSRNFFGLIEEMSPKVKQVGFRDKDGDLIIF